MRASRRDLRGLFLATCLGLLSVLMVVSSGCRDPRDKAGEKADVPSEENGAMMSCLAVIRSRHRQADLYLELGEPKKAIEAVAGITELECSTQAPEVQEAMLDAYGRLATLELRYGDMDRAEKITRQALKRFKQQSFFMAHLLMVQADVMEAQAARLKAQGKIEQAKELQRRAIEVLSQSIRINVRLQQKLLKEPEP